jgi:cytosine/adenosine deaminase-related metal-dependent hydrolase
VTESRAAAPVLTNAHTHLELTGLARLCPTCPTTLTRWLPRLAWQLRARPAAQARESVAQGIAALRACGTTHVGDITATGESVAPLLASGLDGVVYLEVLGLGQKEGLDRLRRAQATIRRARAHPNHGPLRVGLSLHAPYSCGPDLLRAGAAWCRAERVPLCIHVAESQAEVEWLLQGGLALWPRMARGIARRLGVGARALHLRPVAYVHALGVLDARPLLVHAIHVSDAEIQLIADSGCAVVHCPRSNALLSCGTMPLRRYLDAGVRVYLGTDSRASSPDLDVRAEADAARRLHAASVSSGEIEALLRQPL